MNLTNDWDFWAKKDFYFIKENKRVKIDIVQNQFDLL